MAIDSRKDDPIKSIIEIGERFSALGNPSELIALGTTFKNVKRHPADFQIKPLSLLSDTLIAITDNKKNFNYKTYDKVFKVACNVYNLMFYAQEETPDFENLRIVYLELFSEDGMLARNLFNSTIYDCFSDKQNLIRFYKSSQNLINPGEKWDVVMNYARECRKLFFDDDAFISALKNFLVSAQKMSLENMKALCEQEINNLYKMNGVYNISAADIAEVDLKLSEINDLVSRAQIIFDELTASSESIKKTAETATNTMKTTIDTQAQKLHAYLRTEKEDVQKVYDECLSKINDSVKKEILKSTGNFIQESQNQLDNLAACAKSICSNAAIEVSQLNSNADNVISRVKTAVIDDQTVTRLLETTEKNQALIEKINTISALPQVAAASVVPVVQTVAPAVNAGAVSAVSQPSVNILGNDEDKADLTPLELLDPSIPFSERFQSALQKKNEMIIEGATFHEKFDDVLIAVLENTNPYLIGPSGCGKTYLVKQVGDVLGLTRTDIGYINEEYDILGFQTANGSYSKPNFYRCYKYGGIAFCDELDNGNSRASVKLNSFLSNTEDAYFCFPNGEIVPRHPNFRFVSAGNTDGNGANMNYNSREKIEESVMQRLLPIYIGYDNTLEKEILKDYPQWFNFVCLFRKATTEWQNTNGVEASGIITTRDTARIKNYLTNHSFDSKAIIKYEFIQTKNLNYLTFLMNYMTKNNKNNDVKPLLDIFVSYTEQYKKDGGWNR